MASKASSAPTTEKPAAVTANVAKQAKQGTPSPSRSRFSACWEGHQSKKKVEKPSTEQPEPGTAGGAKEPIKQKPGDPEKGSDAHPREKEIPCFKDKSNWERFLKDSKKTCQLIVVNFTTTWSTPCIDANKGIKDLPKKYEDVKFANVDIDCLLDVTKAFDVTKMPTFVLLKRKEGIEKGDSMKGSKKGSSGNEDSQKGKESGTEGSQTGQESGKEGSQKGKESGKEGSQKGKEGGKDKPENAKNARKNSDEKEGTKKGEKENFVVVAKVEGWNGKKTDDEKKKLGDIIDEHRYLIIDNPMPNTVTG